MTQDIRRKQRFNNFEKSFQELSLAVQRGVYDKLSQAGLIQMFELTFELAWKTLKDKLESEGVSAQSPREVLKTAFQYQYNRDGRIWMEALEDRNLLAHTYDEAKSDQARDLIRGKYFKMLQDLYQSLKKRSGFMKFGFKDQEWLEIQDEVILFGSPAMGNFKPASDVDLALKGKIDFRSIQDPAFRSHIDRRGIVIYARSSNHSK